MYSVGKKKVEIGDLRLLTIRQGHYKAEHMLYREPICTCSKQDIYQNHCTVYTKFLPKQKISQVHMLRCSKFVY